MPPIGKYDALVTLTVGTYGPDGDGGYTTTYAPLDPPTEHAMIQAAGARDLERVTGGTVLSTATHLIRMRYRPDVTEQCRVAWQGRTFEVQSARDPDERRRALILICMELKPTTPGPPAEPAAPPRSGAWDNA